MALPPLPPGLEGKTEAEVRALLEASVSKHFAARERAEKAEAGWKMHFAALFRFHFEAPQEAIRQAENAGEACLIRRFCLIIISSSGLGVLFVKGL